MSEKLFEIPVYALSEELLAKRVNNKNQQMMIRYNLAQTFSENPQKIEQIINMETYPQKLWRYNHIVGYIVIYKDNNDIIFKQFVSAKRIKRYHWNSRNKTFLINNQLVGYHFRLEAIKSGDMLRKKLHEYLNAIIENMIDHRFYVDREAFDHVDRLLDYEKLLHGT